MANKTGKTQNMIKATAKLLYSYGLEFCIDYKRIGYYNDDNETIRLLKKI